MKRAVPYAIVLVSVLGASPAGGQTGDSGWTAGEMRPAESAGELVLTFTATQPGRVTYYTLDGDCNRNPFVEDPDSPLPPADCGRPQARASEDYGAVRGEWIFTEAGSRTIRIPIVDDDDDEADEEAFGVHASEFDDVAGQTTWYAVVVRIVDDDRTDASGAPPAVVTTVGRPAGRPADASPVATAPPVPTSTAARAPSLAAPPSPPLGSAPGSGALEPGPGFELVSGNAEREPGRGSEGAGDAGWWAFGLGSTALGSGGFAWLRRRTRWSATQP